MPTNARTGIASKRRKLATTSTNAATTPMKSDATTEIVPLITEAANINAFRYGMDSFANAHPGINRIPTTASNASTLTNVRITTRLALRPAKMSKAVTNVIAKGTTVMELRLVR